MSQKQQPKSTSATAPKNATNKAPAAAAPDAFDAFEGEDIGEADIDGWYNPEKCEERGRTVVGKLVGYLPLPDEQHGGDRPNVLIELERPCEAIADSERVMLEKGRIIAVGIRVKLIEMLYYVEGRARVYLEATEKIPLKGGKSMWKFRVKVAKGSKRGNLPRSSKRDMASLKRQLEDDERLPTDADPDADTPF